MRHNKSGRRLGRTTSHRVAMFRNMVTSLLDHERITTTDAKAKELRTVVDRMITLGKKGDLHSIRLASSFVRDKKVITKLFSSIAPRYKDRNGGYTRIIKLGLRPGDNAPVSVIELVEEQLPLKKAKSAVKAPKLQAVSPGASSSVEVTPVTAVNVVEELCEAKTD